MSADGAKISSRLDALLDVNKKMLAVLEKDDKGKKKGEGKGEGEESKGKGKAPAAGIGMSPLAGFATDMKSLVEVATQASLIEPRAKVLISDFYATVFEDIVDPILEYTTEKLLHFAKFIDSISKGTMLLMKGLAWAAILGPIAIIGATMFSIVIQKVNETFVGLEKMKKKQAETLAILMGMAKSIGMFMVVMALTSLVAPQVLLGTFIFNTVIASLALTLYLVDKVVGSEKGFKKGPLGSLLQMGQSIAIFSLVLILLSFVGPQIAKGTLVFIGMLAGISYALYIAYGLTKDWKPDGKDNSPLGALWKISMGIAVTVLVILALSTSVVQKSILTGGLVFVGMLLAIALALKWAHRLAGEGNKKGSPLESLYMISAGIAVISLVMIILGIPAVNKLYMAGATSLMLGMLFTAVGLYALSKADSKNGAVALIIISASLLVFVTALAFYKVSGAGDLTFGQLLMLGLTVAIMATAAAIMGKQKGDVTSGAIVLVIVAASLIVFVGALVFYVKTGTAEFMGSPDGLASIITLGLTIAGLGIAAAVIGKKAAQIAIGAGVMILMGISLIVFVKGLAEYVKSGAAEFLATPKGWESLGALAAVIAGLGLAAGIIGAPVINIAVGIGAALMIVLGGALILFVKGLSEYTKANAVRPITKDDADILGHTITTLGSSIAGLSLVMGITLGLGYFVAIGYALRPFTEGLKTFMEAKYTKESGEMLKDAVNATVTAFVKPFSELKYSDMPKLLFGVFILGRLSSTLGTLAKGVADMAQQEVVEFELINPGTENAKLVPKSKRKLSQQDFTNANTFVRALLGMNTDGSYNNQLTTALTDFGKAASGGSSWFSRGHMSYGIDMLAKLSGILGSVGEGVLKLAEAEFVPMTVANPGTSDAKLVPGAPVKITIEHFKKASEFINNLIGNPEMTGDGDARKLNANPLVTSLFSFGKLAKEGGGWFGNGYLAEGINTLASLSTVFNTMGEGILKMANGEFVPMTVINPGTKDAKLVPGTPIKIEQGHFTAAADFITRLVGNVDDPEKAGKTKMNPLVQALYDFGKNAKKGGGWFAKGYLTAGVEMLAKISGSLGTLGESVLKMAMGEFTMNEIVDGKLTPTKVVRINTETLTTAATNLNAIVDFLPKAMYDAGLKYGVWKREIESGSTGLAAASVKYKEIAEIVMGSFSDTDKVHKSVDNYNYFISSIFTTTDYAKMDGNLSQTLLEKYDKFAKTTESLSKIADPFEKFVKSFGDMAKHMGVFANNFKVMDPISIKAFKDWTDSMILISKVDIGKSEGIVNFINDSVSAAFGGGKSTTVGDKSPQAYNEADKRSQAQSMMQPGESAQAQQQQQQPAQIDTEAIISAIQQGFSSITVDSMTVLKMKTGR